MTLTVNPAALGITTGRSQRGRPDSRTPPAWRPLAGSPPTAGPSPPAASPPASTLNPATGAITGTPASSGSSPVGVTVTDSSSPTPGSVSRSYTLTVNPSNLNPSNLAITASALPSGTVNQPYSAALSASGGATPYTWTATGLPQGLTLNSATGVISGQPTRAGSSSVKLQVTDSSKPTQKASATLVVTVTSSPHHDPDAAGRYRRAVLHKSLATSGGLTPLSWSVTSGSLPAGLTLNPTTGAVTGTPTAAGTSTVGITVTDSSTPVPATGSKTFTLTVNPAKLADRHHVAAVRPGRPGLLGDGQGGGRHRSLPVVVEQTAGRPQHQQRLRGGQRHADQGRHVQHPGDGH